MTNPMAKMADYIVFLSGIKSRIQSARIVAAHSVNRVLIHLYWSIGKGITEKQETLGWGMAVVERLLRDLRKEHNPCPIS